MLSHVNDSGFWLFKKYFQLSVKQAFKTWTLQLSPEPVIELVGVLILSVFVSAGGHISTRACAPRSSGIGKPGPGACMTPGPGYLDVTHPSSRALTPSTRAHSPSAPAP